GGGRWKEMTMQLFKPFSLERRPESASQDYYVQPRIRDYSRIRDYFNVLATEVTIRDHSIVGNGGRQLGAGTKGR
ncbi:MAG: hypothetical protein V1255_01590, partial [Alphaproteobacteria bacterium]|nr:hypothetical protein [Alphaproteobacteria bacterium]